METRIFETEQQAAQQICKELEQLIGRKPNALLCLAAGHTSLKVFEALIQAQEAGTIDFSQVHIVGLDEWLGLGPEDDGSCAGFVQKNLLDHLAIPKGQIRLFNGKAENPLAECAAIEQFIQEHGQIDYMLLGMGMNGHLALNEPGCSWQAGAHIAVLSDTTKRVGQKYFAKETALSKGITLGIANILASREIVLEVAGEHKRDMTQRLLEEAPTADLPASALKGAKHARLYLDRAAAGPAQ